MFIAAMIWLAASVPFGMFVGAAINVGSGLKRQGS